jgi:hypothetical protein
VHAGYEAQKGGKRGMREVGLACRHARGMGDLVGHADGGPDWSCESFTLDDK